MYTERQGSRGTASWISSLSRWNKATYRSHSTSADEAENEDPERVPFLQPSDRSLRSDADKRSPHNPIPSAFAVTITACIVMLILDIASSVPTAPRMVIFEDIICRNHYAAWWDISKLGDCKVKAVQGELALINGWKETFEKIPALLVSIPYGALADRIGRKKVLLLALTGCLLCDTWVAIMQGLFPRVFPLRAVWVSGLWQLVGGGGALVISMCYTLIGDVCSPEKRTTAFSQLYAAVLISELISIPLGSALISLDPWIPVLGSLGFMALGILFALLFAPNFVNSAAKSQDCERDIQSQGPNSVAPGKMRDRLSYTWAKVGDNCQWITRDVCLMLGAFFMCQLSRQGSGILLQYSSFKFNWGYAKASYLISLRSGINLVVLATLIPALKRLFTKFWRTRQTQSDKYITLISGLCLALGSFIIFLAASPGFLILGQIVSSIGFAFAVTAHSLLTAMVDPRHLGLANTGVTATNSVGHMAGGPLLATIFQWGLQMGGFWVGIPFLFTAALLSIATLAVSISNAP
ncbi:MFS multidrug transporter [Aspergillus bombycis]|uniref:MFS multidrug transporter n=1 Tax=Aspergillus bombycis TaxID=109264 RepID=A0A1F7ZS07_9EURO|nr:MFS multidrug transporter [Aspergillus bombycis]OGM41898.1 MFS multidrug transporter [Aspergillus bombycis]